MQTYVALLRGINVGGRNKLAMADLRQVLRDLGHGDEQTYLQSGNAVFTSDRTDAGAIGRELQERVRHALGLDLTVVVRTPDQLAEVVEGNPLPQAAASPTKLQVAFLAGEIAPEKMATVDAARFSPDELRAGPGVVYLWYPNGAGRSRLTIAALERLLDVRMTARNWRSVMALVELGRSKQGR